MKYHWCVWRVLAVFGPHSVCPHSWHVCFLVYNVQAPGCSVGELLKADPGSRALPRSKLLRFRFLGTLQRHRLGWACVLCPSQVRAAQVTRYLVSTLSQVGGASYHLPHPSHSLFWVYNMCAFSGVLCFFSGELISGCDPPGRCQQSRIPRSLG